MMTRFALGFGLAVGLARPALAASTITMLDTAGDVGRHASLAIGADGLGLIAYQDLTNRDLKVAHCSNTACTAATLSILDAGDVDSVSKLVIGSDGRGLIAYYDSALPGLKTAHCNDVACTTATIRTIQTGIIAEAGMAIGSDGLPLLSYVIDSSGSPRLRAVHCNSVDCTSVTNSLVGFGNVMVRTVVAIATDGLGLVALGRDRVAPPEVHHCENVACSVPFAPEPPPVAPPATVSPQDMAIPADGLGFIGYHEDGPGPTDIYARFSRCANATCFGTTPIFSIITAENAAVAVQPNGLPWLAHGDNDGRIALRSCGDAACSTMTVACANVHPAFYISLAKGSDGRSLVAFYRLLGGLGVAHDVSDACADPEVNVADASVMEAPGAQISFPIALTAPSALPVTVEYATANGTAVAGQDYVAVSGIVTFPPGATSAEIRVDVLTDLLAEPEETFVLSLLAANGAILSDLEAVGTIVDGTPVLAAGSCERVEGDSGTQGCVVAVSLAPATTQTVTVAYATADGTATAGSDYVAASGTLTFTPGSTSQTVSVSVIGDVAVELDETFFVNLSSPVNAAIGDGEGEGLIVDDDAPSLSSLELTHGARIRADLAAAPGPLADQDLYRLAQAPYSSWEIVVDEVSGDVSPGLLVERLAEDNSTVLQTGAPVGAGSAQALRWQRREATTEVRHHIRVSNPSCSTDCGPDDTYRLRALETTGRIPRFNNAGSQVTVLILQNASDQPIQVNADFWDASGARRATVTASLAPHGVEVVSTSTVAGLAGVSGSVTLTHDGPYGALSGKAVALEPSTGFSFDSPMTPKPR